MATSIGQIFLHSMLIQRDFYINFHFAIIKWLQHITIRASHLGTLEGLRIRVGGAKDHGHIVLRANIKRSIDAVHPTLYIDIHQYQVRP